MHLLSLTAVFWATAATSSTWTRDIAPVVYRECASCHRPGGVAPFSLLTYADASKRAALIAKVTASRYMPPWLPSAPHFQNERRLSAAEIASIGRWAAAGAPEGNPADAPPPPKFLDGWQLGKPDLESEMLQEFQIPAEGPDLYQCFAVPSGSARDRWVRALDIRPGNPKSVHHVLLFQDTTGTARKRDTGSGYPCFGTPGFLPARGLGGWTPGAIPYQAPKGIPTLLHARADLVLQVHYHPTGKPETDRTQVGLYFTDEPPKRRSMDIPLGSNRIDIPAGEREYRVTDHFTTPVDVDILAITPHAHYICKEINGFVILPNGSKRTLIYIPSWNFDWQQQYTFATPLRLPAGTRIELLYVYDNSAANTRNPFHPPRRIVWGPASTDEMAGLHLAVTATSEADEEELSQALWGKMIRERQGNSLRRQ